VLRCGATVDVVDDRPNHLHVRSSQVAIRSGWNDPASIGQGGRGGSVKDQQAGQRASQLGSARAGHLRVPQREPLQSRQRLQMGQSRVSHLRVGDGVAGPLFRGNASGFVIFDVSRLLDALCRTFIGLL